MSERLPDAAAGADGIDTGSGDPEMSDRVLCAWDDSPASQAAARIAIRLAQRLGLRVDLLHVVLPHSDALDLPEALHQEAASRDVALRFSAVRDFDPVAAIAEHCAEALPALLVVGNRSHSRLHHLLVGSTALGLIRLDRVPVLVCAEGHDARFDGRTRAVLAATDLSEHSAATLRWAEAIAAADGAELELVHAVDPALAPPYFPSDWIERRREDARTALKEHAERHLRRLRPTLIVEVGRPHEAIAAHARAHGSDLLVMARSGLGALERMLVGSVTERMLGRPPCPVLVLPSTAEGLQPPWPAPGDG